MNKTRLFVVLIFLLLIFGFAFSAKGIKIDDSALAIGEESIANNGINLGIQNTGNIGVSGREVSSIVTSLTEQINITQTELTIALRDGTKSVTEIAKLKIKLVNLQTALANAEAAAAKAARSAASYRGRNVKLKEAVDALKKQKAVLAAEKATALEVGALDRASAEAAQVTFTGVKKPLLLTEGKPLVTLVEPPPLPALPPPLPGAQPPALPTQLSKGFTMGKIAPSLGKILTAVAIAQIAGQLINVVVVETELMKERNYILPVVTVDKGNMQPDDYIIQLVNNGTIVTDFVAKPNSLKNVYYEKSIIKDLQDSRWTILKWFGIFEATSGEEEAILAKDYGPLVDSVKIVVYKDGVDPVAKSCEINEITRFVTCDLSSSNLSSGKYNYLLLTAFNPALFSMQIKAAGDEIIKRKCNYVSLNNFDYCPQYSSFFANSTSTPITLNAEVVTQLESYKTKISSDNGFFKTYFGTIADTWKKAIYDNAFESAKKYSQAKSGFGKFLAIVSGARNVLIDAPISIAQNTELVQKILVAETIALRTKQSMLGQIDEIYQNPYGAGAMLIGLPVFQEADLSKVNVATSTGAGYAIFKINPDFVPKLSTVKFSASAMWDMGKYSKKDTALHKILISDKLVASNDSTTDSSKLFFKQVTIDGKSEWVVVINNLPSTVKSDTAVVWSAEFNADGSRTTGVGGFKITSGGDAITPGVCGELDTISVKQVNGQNTLVCEPIHVVVNTSGGSVSSAGASVGTASCPIILPDSLLPYTSAGLSCLTDADKAALDSILAGLDGDYRDSLTAYDAKETDVESTLASLKGTSASGGSQASNIVSALDGIVPARIKVNENQEKKDALDAAIISANAEIAALRAKITILESASASASASSTSQLTGLRAQLAQAQTSTNNLQGTLSSTNAVLASAKKTEEDLKATISGLNASAAATTNNLIAKIDDLSMQNTDLQNKLKALLVVKKKETPACPSTGSKDFISINPGCINVNVPPVPASSGQLTATQVNELYDSLSVVKVSTNDSPSFVSITNGLTRVDFKKTESNGYVLEEYGLNYLFSLEKVSFGSGLAFTSDVPAVITSGTITKDNPWFSMYSRVGFDAISVEKYARDRETNSWNKFVK